MPTIDMPLEELRRYRATVNEPSDFDSFWAKTLQDVPRDEPPVFTPVDTGLVAVETYDVSFTGFGGDPIRAWLHMPAAAVRPEGPLPGVVQFQGYNGGRGLAHEHVFWALAGYAHLVVDTRGQGSGWTTGDTPDPAGSGPSQPGFLTRGIDDPTNHFYRRVFTDAVRAVEVFRAHPLVDAERACVTGISQGGGITLAVAALVPDLAAAMPDVPFLCDFRRACAVSPAEPYGEVVRYLKAHRDQVEATFATLSYFDGAIMARRARVPALFSVALMDQICPPSTVFGAFHAYGGRKDIVVYPYNDHEGGEAFQHAEQLRWLAETLAG